VKAEEGIPKFGEATYRGRFIVAISFEGKRKE
jgi:hypothetical protein